MQIAYQFSTNVNTTIKIIFLQNSDANEILTMQCKQYVEIYSFQFVDLNKLLYKNEVQMTGDIADLLNIQFMGKLQRHSIFISIEVSHNVQILVYF